MAWNLIDESALVLLCALFDFIFKCIFNKKQIIISTNLIVFFSFLFVEIFLNEENVDAIKFTEWYGTFQWIYRKTARNLRPNRSKMRLKSLNACTLPMCLSITRWIQHSTQINQIESNRMRRWQLYVFHFIELSHCARQQII